MKSINYFFSLLKVAKTLVKIKSEHRNCLVFIALSGIGDICYCFSVIDELKREKNKKIILVAGQYTSQLKKYYSCVDEVIVLAPDEEQTLKKFIQKNQNHYVYNSVSQKLSLYCCFPLTHTTYKKLKKQGSNYIDILSGILNEKSVFPTYPKVKENDDFKLPFDNADKTVVINPYSNSLEFDDNEVFSTIITELKSKGYNVYTNVVGEQLPLQGTSELRCSIEELYNISRKVRLFISIRSGITDFCISSGGNFLVLYNNEWNGDFRRAYTLTSWKTNSKIFEFDYKDTNQILNTLNDLCK